MAYGIKYRFKFESAHGVDYTVNLLEDGYEGSIITRPLGKAPVIRMQENGCFRSTSCNLTLECQVDGEFAELYTSDPLQFRIDVFRGDGVGTLIWSGFVAAEIYSEPDIYPPYDVAVTATDGLGVLKEYDFEPQGLQKVRELLGFFLRKTGLSMPIYCATSEGPTAGSPVTLFDATSINMDYMAGENCYEVFDEMLRSLHLTVTQYGGAWLMVRETDLSDKVTSSGGLTVYSIPSRAGSSSNTTTATISGVRKTIGKMGVADLWPVGHLTRRVVPAKREVTIEAPWHKMNAAPSVAADGWSKNSAVTHYSDPGYYKLGKQVSGLWTAGDIYSSISFSSFQADINIGIKYNPANEIFAIMPTSSRMLRVRVIWETEGGTMYHFDPQDGWVAGTEIVYLDAISLADGQMNSYNDPALAMEATYSIPAFGGTSPGTLTVVVSALVADVYDVNLEVGLSKGYEDRIVIDNGARGQGEKQVITGGRALYGYLNQTSMYGGLFVQTTSPGTAVTAWSDNRRYGLDFLSITALDYALSVALPRVELSGKFDVPAGLSTIPFVLSLRSVLHQMTTYDWNLLEDEVNFVALSVPAASMTVESETITSMPDESSQASYSGGSSSGGGGSYTLPIASASTLGGVKVGSGLSIDGTTGVLSATGGGGGGIMSESDPVFAANGEKTANKVTSLSSSSNDTQYPSAKCVYDIVGNIESLLASL